MFAGAMYQTDRLNGPDSTVYAYIFIFVNTFVGLYLFRFALREVKQSLPLIGMVFSNEFWLTKVWPFALTTFRYHVFGNKYRRLYVEVSKDFYEHIYDHDEKRYREQLVGRLAKYPLLSFAGRKKSSKWIRDESSTMRDGLLFCEFLHNHKVAVNRSMFVYMVTSPKSCTYASNFDYKKHDDWLSSFGSAFRVIAKHHESNTCILSDYGIAKGIRTHDNLETFVSLGCVDVHKMIDQFIQGSHDDDDIRNKDIDVRPYVDISDSLSYEEQSGNYYMCFINKQVSDFSKVSVTLCDTAEARSNRLSLLTFEVDIQRLRVYSRVYVSGSDGRSWPAEITLARKDGKFNVRYYHITDSLSVYNKSLVSRLDLSPISEGVDSPVGFVW